jgi:endonuclease V-like protein UPF0215 family
VKAGVRALGVAESYRGDESTLAGAVVRASRVVDGFVFGTCTVGGTDATETVHSLVERLDRADVRYLLCAGVAPAWFNLLDLPAIYERVDRPVLSVTFEESPGLESALREAFDGPALDERLATYRRQPDRRPVTVNGERVFVRSVGVKDDAAADVVRGFTPEGGRPEPLRVARLAARAADERFVGDTDA